MSVFSSSRELYRNSLKPGETGHDAVFLLAKMTNVSGAIFLDIDGHTPSVVLDREAASLPITAQTPRIFATQELVGIDGGTPDYSLISGGCIFWLLPYRAEPARAILLQRDKNAPTGAGQWAHSAGRCDERLADSVVHHGAKEILLLIKRAGTDVFRPVIVDSAHLADDLRFKAQQVCDRAEALASHGVVAGDVDVVNPIIVKSSMMPHEEGLVRLIELRIDGEVQERINAVYTLPTKTNTIEIIQSVPVMLDAGDQVVFIDGEKYNRNVRDYTLAELADLSESKSLRPAIDAYVQLVHLRA